MIHSAGVRGAILANVFRNILRLSFGDLLAKTLNFLAFVYLARRLGAEMFGVLEFANALLIYFLFCADAGLELWAIREASRAADVRELAGRVMPIRVLFALIVITLMIGSIPLLPDYIALSSLIVLFSLTVLAQAVSLKWAFIGRQRMTEVAGGLVLAQIVFAAGVLLLVRDAANILSVAVLRLASEAALSLFFAFRFLRESGGANVPLTLRNVPQMLRPAATMGATNALALLSYNFDAILLGFLRDSAAVAIYNVAYKPVTMSLALPVTYFQGLFPALSSAFHENREEYSRLVVRSFRLCVVFAIPLGTLVSFLAQPIVLFLFGTQYEASAAVLRVLAWSAVLVILRGTFRQALNAAGAMKLDLQCALAASLANVALNFALIPPFGSVGAATATLLSESLWLSSLTVLFSRRIQSVPLLRILFRPLLAGLILALSLWLVSPLWWLFQAGIGATVYFGSLILAGEPEVSRVLRKVRSLLGGTD